MKNQAKSFLPTGVHGVRRGDIYYVDFGTIEDSVGRETAKKRPVLIIQNNLGNKMSDTTICLCMSSRHKENSPYHVFFGDTNIVKVPSDICAEQIKTIDKCRLEMYMGNVGERTMREVDKAIALSLGIKVSKDGELDISELSLVEEPQEECTSAYQFLQEQLSFWNGINVQITTMRSDLEQIDEEIESVLNHIEGTSYNVAQGYRMYKILRDKRMERKKILKEVLSLEALKEQVDIIAMIGAFQSSIDNASRRISDVDKVVRVKELAEVV